MDAHKNSLTYINDFELYDFVDNPNFDQFINLIRGETEDVNRDFSSDLINDCFDNNQILSNSFDQNNNNAVNVYDPSSTFSSFSCFDEEVKGQGDEEHDGEHSSGTTTTTTTNNGDAKPKLKSDRSKTLISERRRRTRMKEKLYELRSLVPNITKMDKASIIGDAVSYVHELQAQARKLTAEVDMFQVEERGYYAKIVCNKGEGVAASLYRALESLAGFNVQNSNLATVCDSCLLTFALNVKGSEREINLPNLKLWVTSALLNQGFEFMTSFEIL
ncbi:hypothetical protein Fmac_019572 [Flemingia macrophylla]|uniref:BHLH domain-containing protein n=1 Tax=Flemingia macrophylla TaxID=520843 RepID=A0ABD1M857_9FABA